MDNKQALYTKQKAYGEKMKNLKLKSKIIERFGSQSAFAQKMQVAAPCVSQVINGFREIDGKQRKTWARTLKCTVSDIFPEATA